MKMNKTLGYTLVFLFFLMMILPVPVHSQTPDSVQDNPVQKIRITNLELLLKSINAISKEISDIQKTLNSSKGIGREQELRDRIDELNQKLTDLESSFIQVSTGVNISEYRAEKDTAGFDWDKEMSELFEPLINEVKNITARPREIEKLRKNIEFYSSRLSLARGAISHINELKDREKSRGLARKLNSSLEFWKNQENEIGTRLKIAQQQLDRRTNQKKSLTQSARDVFRIFFRSRGRNLTLAFLAFVLTWLFLFYIHKVIQKFSPFHNKDRSFYARFFDMLFFTLSGVFSFLSLVAVLYFYGDWVLLSLAAIFVIGIGWASKQTVPVIWNQIKIILNVGPVRENEVLIYNGLPYEVVSINLYTRLLNRDLAGGDIRLPLRDLLDLRSRPIAENEPWFPSKQGDWVRLKDETHGKVIAQTPETVKLELLGGAIVTYTTEDYLSLSPMNLSSGFRLWISFGVDYAHQEIITSRLLETLEQAVVQGLTEQGHGDGISAVKAQFKEAGPSALEVEIMADFNSSAGPDYDILQRTISRICVDTCNLNNWVIPVNQIRIHMADT